MTKSLTPKNTMVEALQQALDDEMNLDSSVILMGEDIGVNGGVFRVTKDLQKKYGSNRVIDSPLAECGIVGTACGMAVAGLRPVVEIQFSGFMMQAFDQIEQNMARLSNRTQGKYAMKMVVRAPFGGGIRAVEHHSESREAYWAHTPGLKVVIPSGPQNAYSLLRASIQSDDPVIFYEPKSLYRAFRETLIKENLNYEIGKAHKIREGKDLTIVTYGAMVRPAQDAAEDLFEEHGIEPEIIDLLTISPMDTELVCESVKKTGRCIIVHEGQKTCGIGSEVSSRIQEHVFEWLLAPITRLTGYDLHFPYFQTENFFLPNSTDIVENSIQLMEWR